MRKHEPDVKITHGVTRRSFLKTAAAAAPVIVLPHVAFGASKLNIGVIGVGGRGSEDLQQLDDENIVALCDVDQERAAGSFKKYPNAKRYTDFRVMFEKEKGIEAVVVATPDHTHAVAAMAAIKHGKHVYCEKPLTRTVREARLLAEAARDAKVATQMGNQGMAFEGNRLINEWIWAGAIGPVREIHAWSDRPTHDGKLFWAQGVERPTETPPVPATLDWDLWLGPAPYRPYHPAYVPFAWRGWWDFGSGGLGDMGIHNLAPVWSALKLGAPVAVDSSSTLVNQEAVPLASLVHYEFPAREDMPPVRLHWYDGGLIPPRPAELEPDRELNREDGLLFVGDSGTILVEGWGGESPRLIPESRMKEFVRPPKTLPRSVGHWAEWVAACKGGEPGRSNFDFAGSLTEAVLLGTVSVRTGKRLTWDPKNMTTGDAQADGYLHYQYRDGWSL
ncbi:MAG TPA: Gfo/Idh/MocA family oxidoreductase [Candidatus Bathyarchaeia archaeon]|nr:Gfo/Idh/MocA family oxidoreductase [Candidatus Bathyarchaeia archaeon]